MGTTRRLDRLETPTVAESQEAAEGRTEGTCHSTDDTSVRAARGEGGRSYRVGMLALLVWPRLLVPSLVRTGSPGPGQPEGSWPRCRHC